RAGGATPAAQRKPPEGSQEAQAPHAGKPDAATKAGAPTPPATRPVKRPDKPPKPADPRESAAKPANNQRIELNPHGPPAPDVCQCLAGVQGYSLDCQELPTDYLNLSTQHSDPLPEARDLINRRLRDRGYPMPLSGDVRSVVKIEKVDPSLVPRV